MNAGEGESGDRLLQRLLQDRDRLFAFIFALVRHTSDAEDLFQEVSMVIMKKVGDGERVRNYGAWSREIAYRTVQNHWKRRKRVPVMLSDESLAAVVDAFAWQEEHHRHDDERVDRLRRCLDRLPDHMRRLVELFYDEGLTLEEIGRRLSRSAGAVQVALSRIRVRLLDCVGEIERREGALGS